MVYSSLKERSRYLKDIHLEGKDKNLRPDEITKCEAYAQTIIEGKLGKSWDEAAVPDLIEHIADLLGSAKAYTFIHTGQTPQQSEYAKELKEEAFGLLDMIKDGKMGIKLPDGSWDEDLAGETAEDKNPDGIEILL